MATRAVERDIQTIEHYEAIGRARPLDPQESAELERAVRRDMRNSGRVTKPWMPEDDQKLIKAIRSMAQDGKRRRRRKVPQIAEQLDRTPRAVWRRLDKLRKKGLIGYISPPNGTGRYPRKGSIAERAQAGV